MVFFSPFPSGALVAGMEKTGRSDRFPAATERLGNPGKKGSRNESLFRFWKVPVNGVSETGLDLRGEGADLSEDFLRGLIICRPMMLSIAMAFHLSTKGSRGIIVGRAVPSIERAYSDMASGRGAMRLPSGGGAIALATILALVARAFLVDLAVVEGRSMEPSFSRGSIVLVVRCAYGLRFPGPAGTYWLRWGRPRPGEIVMAYPKASGRRVVKRVESVGPEARGWGGTAEGRLPPGEVFLLGDNLRESRDSREYGPVDADDVAGRVVRLRL